MPKQEHLKHFCPPPPNGLQRCWRRISVTGEHKEIIRDSEEWKDSSMDKCLAENAQGGFLLGGMIEQLTGYSVLKWGNYQCSQILTLRKLRKPNKFQRVRDVPHTCKNVIQVVTGILGGWPPKQIDISKKMCFVNALGAFVLSSQDVIWFGP